MPIDNLATIEEPTQDDIYLAKLTMDEVGADIDEHGHVAVTSENATQDPFTVKGGLSNALDDIVLESYKTNPNLDIRNETDGEIEGVTQDPQKEDAEGSRAADLYSVAMDAKVADSSSIGDADTASEDTDLKWQEREIKNNKPELPKSLGGGEKPDENGLVYLEYTFTVDPETYRSNNYQPIGNAASAQKVADRKAKVGEQAEETSAESEQIEVAEAEEKETADEALDKVVIDYATALDGTSFLCVDEVGGIDYTKIAMDAKPKAPAMKPNCKTTFAQCRAKNPLYCRYHGPKLLEKDIKQTITALLGKGKAVVTVTKDKGAKNPMTFRLTIGCAPAMKDKVEDMIHKFMTLNPGLKSSEEWQDVGKKGGKDLETTEFEMDILQADKPPKTPSQAEEDAMAMTAAAKEKGEKQPVVGKTPNEIEEALEEGNAPQKQHVTKEPKTHKVSSMFKPSYSLKDMFGGEGDEESDETEESASLAEEEAQNVNAEEVMTSMAEGGGKKNEGEETITPEDDDLLMPPSEEGGANDPQKEENYLANVEKHKGMRLNKQFSDLADKAAEQELFYNPDFKAKYDSINNSGDEMEKKVESLSALLDEFSNNKNAGSPLEYDGIYDLSHKLAPIVSEAIHGMGFEFDVVPSAEEDKVYVQLTKKNPDLDAYGDDKDLTEDEIVSLQNALNKKLSGTGLYAANSKSPSHYGLNAFFDIEKEEAEAKPVEGGGGDSKYADEAAAKMTSEIDDLAHENPELISGDDHVSAMYYAAQTALNGLDLYKQGLDEIDAKLKELNDLYGDSEMGSSGVVEKMSLEGAKKNQQEQYDEAKANAEISVKDFKEAVENAKKDVVDGIKGINAGMVEDIVKTTAMAIFPNGKPDGVDDVADMLDEMNNSMTWEGKDVYAADKEAYQAIEEKYKVHEANKAVSDANKEFEGAVQSFKELIDSAKTKETAMKLKEAVDGIGRYSQKLKNAFAAYKLAVDGVKKDVAAWKEIEEQKKKMQQSSEDGSPSKDDILEAAKKHAIDMHSSDVDESAAYYAKEISEVISGEGYSKNVDKEIPSKGGSRRYVAKHYLHMLENLDGVSPSVISALQKVVDMPKWGEKGKKKMEQSSESGNASAGQDKWTKQAAVSKKIVDAFSKFGEMDDNGEYIEPEDEGSQLELMKALWDAVKDEKSPLSKKFKDHITWYMELDENGYPLVDKDEDFGQEDSPMTAALKKVYKENQQYIKSHPEVMSGSEEKGQPTSNMSSAKAKIAAMSIKEKLAGMSMKEKLPYAIKALKKKLAQDPSNADLQKKLKVYEKKLEELSKDDN